jgi:hypothetical protein
LTQSLGDFVWLDANVNGKQDSGEAGVAGLTITLIGGGADKLINGVGDTTATTTTDADGHYQFNNLLAGVQYQVQFSKPTGTVYTTPNVGVNGFDTIDSDADTTTGKSQIVTLTSGQNNPTIDAGVYRLTPGIDIEKTTNGTTNSNPTAPNYDNEDTSSGAGVPTLTAGSVVTWTYKVTNTGNTNFAKNEIAIVDDNGTTANTADDMSIANGKITYQSGDDGDNVLEAGESWLYKATGTVQPLGGLGAMTTFDFSGNSATDGTDGNTRTYTSGGITVSAEAWSRDKSTGAWAEAFVGAYGGGLGVTDSSEGSGSGDTHTVDNIGRNNYLVFQFSQNVVVDKAFLGYVVGDSDVQVWIGNSAAPITTMSNTVLSSMGFSEVNTTTLSTTRWADLNAGGAAGNVIIIAADTTDTSPEDRFKLEQLTVQAVQSGGVYSNKATVTVAGGLTDSDMSHYKAVAAKASIGNFVWEDANFNGVQDGGEKGIANVTVKLLNSGNTVLSSTTTDATGFYSFGNLNPADYKIQVVAPTGYFVSKKDLGGNDALDSDVDSSGTTVATSLTAGENDLSWDAGLYRKASVGDKVWEDKDHDDIQDSTEPGIGGVRVYLLNSAGTQLASTTTNSTGNYLFSNLDPGVYQLKFDKKDVRYNGDNMSKWMWASKDIGGNDMIDSDVTGDGVARTDVTYTSQFTLAGGQNDMSRDAGITPIVIDLDGNGIQTISRADASAGFDLFGNGTAVKSGWISGSDGFLAVDKNGNGQIDSINELFGGSAKGAGFANLASYDSNGDGLVNDADAAFGQLMIWQDANGNHATDDGELMTLAQAGVASLTVGYTELPFLDAQGNLHLERSSATLASGASVDMTDVYFNVSADDAAAAGVQLPTIADLLGDDNSLDSLLGASPAAAHCGITCADETGNSGDAAETLRRLAALSRDDSHTVLSA